MQVSYRNQPRVISSTRSEFISLQNTADESRATHDPFSIDLLIPRGSRPKPTVDVSTFRWFHSRSPGEENHRIIVENELQWDNCYSELRQAMGEFHVVGFDLEGVALTNYKRAMRFERPEFFQLPAIVHDNIQAERPVLMQIATLSGFVLIIQIGHFQRIPVSLQDFLADESIIKVGVNIQSDAYWMCERWGTPVVGWVDLRSIVKEAEMRVPKEVKLSGRLGLKQLAQIFFGELRVTAECMKVVSYSNWAKKNLSPIQIFYATFDAQIGVDICAVVLMKLNKGISFTADGKSVMNCTDNRFLQSLEKSLHRGYSRQEVPMQALKLEDVISPNSSMDEKSFQFRNYMFSICDAMVENGQAEIPGLERAIRYQIRRDEGRLPKTIRNQAAQYEKPGYSTYVVSKLRADRLKMLPSRCEGRHPPTYWLQVPKISGEVGTRPRNRYSIMWLSDALHWKDMEWCMEMEVVKVVRRRTEYDSGVRRTSNFEMLAVESTTKGNPKKGPRSGSSSQRSEASEDIESEQMHFPLCQKSVESTQQEDSESEKEGTMEEEEKAEEWDVQPHHHHEVDEGDPESYFGSLDEEEDEENYNPEDEGCVREAISLIPCWVCGYRVVDNLVWEPIVPESYLSLYSHLSESRCLCNWARLCIDCCLEWRSAQYETMMELAAIVGCSIEEPKYVAEFTERETRNVLLQLKNWEREKAAGSDASPKDKQDMIRTLQRLCGVSLVNPKEIEELIDTNWYRHAKEPYHELTVLEKLGWDVVEVERVFRIRLRQMCSVTGHHYIPCKFSAIHECRKGRDWSPPTSMTKDEIAHALSKPGFYCDLDAAMDGAAGGLDDEANAHPNLRPTSSETSNKDETTREKQFVTEGERKRKKKKGRRDFHLPLGPKSLSPAVPPLQDTDYRRVDEEFKGNEIYRTEIVRFHSVDINEELITRPYENHGQREWESMGRYSMHQFTDPFVANRGVVSPKIDVNLWSQNSEFQGPTAVRQSRYHSSWQQNPPTNNSSFDNCALGYFAKFERSSTQQEYSSTFTRQNPSGLTNVAGEEFESEVQEIQGTVTSSYQYSSPAGPFRSSPPLSARGSPKFGAVITEESSAVSPPYHPVNHSSSGQTLIFTRLSKQSASQSNPLPRIPGPRGDKTLGEGSKGGGKGIFYNSTKKEESFFPPPAASITFRPSERSFAPAPFPQSQANPPVYEPGPPPFPTPNGHLSIQVANPVKQPSKWGGGSETVSYGLPMRASIVPTNYAPPFADRCYQEGLRNSKHSRFRDSHKSGANQDNDSQPCSAGIGVSLGPQVSYGRSGRSDETQSHTWSRYPTESNSSSHLSVSNQFSTRDNNSNLVQTSMPSSEHPETNAIRREKVLQYVKGPRFKEGLRTVESVRMESSRNGSCTSARTESRLPSSETQPTGPDRKHWFLPRQKGTVAPKGSSSSATNSWTYTGSRTFTPSQNSKNNRCTSLSYVAPAAKTVQYRDR